MKVKKNQIVAHIVFVAIVIMVVALFTGITLGNASVIGQACMVVAGIMFMVIVVIVSIDN